MARAIVRSPLYVGMITDIFINVISIHDSGQK